MNDASLQRYASLTPAFGVICDTIEPIAARSNFKIVRTPQAMEITVPLGLVTFTAVEAGTHLTLDAPTPPELQLLVDVYAERFRAHGLDAGITWSGAMGTRPLNQVHATLRDYAQISPNFGRVRLEGDFGAFARADARLHFRFLFGPSGMPWPYLDDNGLTVWPGGNGAWHRPSYTVRQIAASAEWIDVDIALHDGGRVTEWCQTRRAGDVIALTGPSGSKLPKETDVLLLGDETAMPVVIRMLAGLRPQATGAAYIAVRDQRDAQEVAVPEGVTLHWLDLTAPQPLLGAFTPLLGQRAGQYLFFAAEKAEVAAARAAYQASATAFGSVKFASYWTRKAEA